MQPQEPITTGSDTLMARVAGERSIPLKSDVFQRGLQQFEANPRRCWRNTGLPASGIHRHAGQQ
jgi:hypothetical protein